MSRVRAVIERSEVSDEIVAPHRRMTEQQFVDWCTSETWAEWVDGEVLVMSPVNTEHSRLREYLARLLGTFVEEHDLGEILGEPAQTRFARLKRRRSPDIFFVSSERSNIIETYHVEGAPDLIIEIVSPDSRTRDYRDKFLDYQDAGVREYWIVDPTAKTVAAYTLTKKAGYELIPEKNAAIHSQVLSRFYLKPAWLWKTRLPKVSDLIKEISSSKR